MREKKQTNKKKEKNSVKQNELIWSAIELIFLKKRIYYLSSKVTCFSYLSKWRLRWQDGSLCVSRSVVLVKTL